MRNLFIVLAAVLMGLGVVGYQRWSASQRQLAMHDLSPGKGISVVHFYADW